MRLIIRNHILTILCIISLIIATGCCNKEKTLEDAANAYKTGDYKSAAAIYAPKAIQGDAEALVNLAFMHYCGLHVEQDHEKAFDYYLQAAQKNNVTAQFSLGTMYENGEGIPSNLSEAYFWYLIAENQKDIDSQRLRREAERRLSTNIIKEIRRRVEEWRPER